MMQKRDPSFTLSKAKTYFREHVGSIVPVNFSAEHCCDDPTLPADAEIRFLEFISDKGLTLFKPLNSQNSAWGRVQKNADNSIEIKNCHQ
jgi:hypothetical protein